MSGKNKKRIFAYLSGFLTLQIFGLIYFKWRNATDVVKIHAHVNIGIKKDIRNAVLNQHSLGMLPSSTNTSGNYACSHPDASTMAILVHSAMKSQRLRDAIRNSWARTDNLANYGASLYFFIGKSKTGNSPEITQELQQYSDLIQLDFIDAYLNLSKKSVEIFRWASQHCPNVQYILKQDDDTYVNLTKLLMKLSDFQAAGKHEFIAGYHFPNRQPKRHPDDPYYTPLSLWPHQHWPAAVTGPAYVITSNVIRQILRRADDPKTLFVPWEDIYITAVIRNYEQIPIYDIEGMRHPL